MKRLLRASFLVVAAVALAAGIADAQQVNVTVDGEAVHFVGTRPMTQQGRVLVPLRGVLEKMGAFVEWVPATRTVVAQKGDLFVELPVGSRTGMVNGRQVGLDVPAAVTGGSTMVPLRFLGEALGADVKWDSNTRTVVILTSGGAPAGGDTSAAQADITSFSHDARGWLRAGSTVHVTLVGTPGGQASFEIPGAMNSVKMTETSAGRYTGSWTVPSNANITVSGGALIGLLRVGGKEKLIQAGEGVSVDTVAPKISDRRPVPDNRVTQTSPGISVVFSDGSGSGVDTSGVTMTVNGTDVTSQTTVTPSLAAYKPAKALPAGEVKVELNVKDQAGNQASTSWKFVIRAASDVIKSFTHSDITNLEPGDVLTVKMQGEPGGTASFAIVQGGQAIRTLSMKETAAGNYEGEYTIRRDDRLAGARITGTLKTAAGESFTTDTEETIGGTSVSALAPPVITQPKTGAAVQSPLTVKGTAPAGSRVSLRIDYVATILGAVQMNGTIAEQMVDVDSKGNFASDPISLGTLVKGKNTRYTLTAATVGGTDEQSDPVTVTFTGS